MAHRAGSPPASLDAVLPALRTLHERILHGAMAEYDGYREATGLDRAQPAVAWVSADATRTLDHAARGWAWMRGQALPPAMARSDEAGWTRLFELLNELDGAIGARDFDRSTELLVAAARRYHHEHVRLQVLLDRQRNGAGAAVAVLEGVVGICVLIESAGVGGLAAAGGAGLLKIAAVSGLAAGVARGTFRTAQLGAERMEGIDDHHFLDVLREAGAEALTTFIGALVGGKLSSFFLSRCGRYLGQVIEEETLIRLGQIMQLSGKLPRDWFVGPGQRALVSFLSGVGATPFGVVARSVYMRFLGGEKLTMAQLLDLVVAETAHAGLFQLFIGACFHLYASRPAGGAHEPVTEGAAATAGHASDFGALLDGGGLHSREELAALLQKARLDPAVAPLIAHIPDAQVMAVIGYTGADYKVINLALRMGDHRLLARLAPYIELTKSGLRGLPVHEGTCWRGVASLPKRVLARYKVGAIVTEDAFTSTSYELGAQFPGEVQFTVWSRSGRKIGKLSQVPVEQEALFPAGSRFEVLEHSSTGSQTAITLREVEQ